MKLIFAIFRKEIIDVMRDRRTLMMVSFSALLFVPLMLVIFLWLCHSSNLRLKSVVCWR